jgi:drug/metabolite transporter (DMT)-like permease
MIRMAASRLLGGGAAVRDLPDGGLGNRLGILAMVLAVVVFGASDALVKIVGEAAPSAQTIGLHSLLAAGWLALALAWKRAWPPLAVLRHRALASRTVLECLGAYAYLFALFHVPLAAATAVKLTGPLILSVLAVVALKERVAGPLWLAALAGFAGVICVVQPDTIELDRWLALLVVATVVNALRDVATRRVPGAIPALAVAFAASALVAAVGCGWALADGWQPMPARQVAVLLAGSVLLAMGYLLVVLATRLGELAVVGPFRYGSAIWAIVLAYALWHEVPNTLAIGGAIVIAGAGFAIVALQRRRSPP